MEKQNRTVTHNYHQPTNTFREHTNSNTNTTNMNIMLLEPTKAVPVVMGAEPDSEVVVKRGRGRPQKYDANGRLLSPTLVSPPLGFLTPDPFESHAVKRRRGRPRGSGKLQILASIGGCVVETAGGSFTLHVVIVNIGEDVVSKILSFFQKGPRAVCILSAIGPVSSVVIHQPSVLGGILKYEGRFEILSLSGSCTYINGTGGAHRKEGMLSVSLAKSDGRVFGGGIESSLIAAGPIQLVMATFKQNISKQIKRRHSSQPSDARNVPDNQGSERGRLKVARLEGEQSCPLPTTPPAPLVQEATANGVHDGVTIATTNGVPEDVISAATTTTNGIADNVIPTDITEDLIMHSASVDDGVDLGQRTLAHVDTNVPHI